MIRAVGDADTEAIADFFAAVNRLDAAVGTVSAEDWRRFAALPQNRGGRDFRLAAEDGRIAGIAMPSLRDEAAPLRHFRIVVAPELRRRGIGSMLLRELAAMDAPHPAVLQSLCPERWEAASAFLAASGFAAVETELEMLCDDAAAAAETAFRRDVPVRVAEDPGAIAEALAAIHNSAYAGTPSFVRLTGAGMAAAVAAPTLLIVAETRGRPSGYCHVAIDGTECSIESLAVSPDRQRTGIGTALLVRALAEAARRGGRRVRLAVSDRNAAAYVLYRRLGFGVVAKSLRWRAPREQVIAALERRGR